MSRPVQRIVLQRWTPSYVVVALLGCVVVFTPHFFESPIADLTEGERVATFPVRTPGGQIVIVESTVGKTDQEMFDNLAETATFLTSIDRSKLSPELDKPLSKLIADCVFILGRHASTMAYVQKLRAALFEQKKMTLRFSVLNGFVFVLIFASIGAVSHHEKRREGAAFRAKNALRISELEYRERKLHERERSVTAAVERGVAEKMLAKSDEIAAREAAGAERLRALQNEYESVLQKRNAAREAHRAGEQAAADRAAALDEREAELSRRQVALDREAERVAEGVRFAETATALVARLDGYASTFPELIKGVLEQNPGFRDDLARFREGRK